MGGTLKGLFLKLSLSRMSLLKRIILHYSKSTVVVRSILNSMFFGHSHPGDVGDIRVRLRTITNVSGSQQKGLWPSRTIGASPKPWLIWYQPGR